MRKTASAIAIFIIICIFSPGYAKGATQESIPMEVEAQLDAYIKKYIAKYEATNCTEDITESDSDCRGEEYKDTRSLIVSYRNNNPQIIDFSRLLRTGKKLKRTYIPIERINNRTGGIELILERNPLKIGDPGILYPAGKKDQEQALIRQNAQVVRRSGKDLIISTSTGSQIKFLDWSEPTTSVAEGDGESFIYAGVLRNSGFHKIDVNYEHDSPGSFLVDPSTDKILYVHGSELASISPNNQRLFIMNDGLNPPFGIIVFLLSDKGHGVELQCTGPRTGTPKIIPFFKGWHIKSYVGFDVVLIVGSEKEGQYEAMPIRFSYENSKWHVFMPDPERQTKLTDFFCWQ